MRIQHNIMAMNAYRNYTNNTSALSKNLEKLSSGYRINRAGDDAAGLAISEKMRAQITGLSAAQKNVKDGISLVKTAEGATQEIHDMLNRMVYLAEQSANGTYQDEVDREAITNEFEQLKSEIDRIADSSNFNGIKLLDGSLAKEQVATKIDVTGMATAKSDGVKGKYYSATAITQATGVSVGGKFQFTASLEDGSSKTVTLEMKFDDDNKKTYLEAEDGTRYDIAGNTNAVGGNSTVTQKELTDAFAKELAKTDLGKNYNIATGATAGTVQMEAKEVGTGISQVKSFDFEYTLTGDIKDRGVLGMSVAIAATAVDAGVEVDTARLTEYNGKNYDDAVFSINGKKFVVMVSSMAGADLGKDGEDMNAAYGLGEDVTILIGGVDGVADSTNANFKQNMAKIEEATGLKAGAAIAEATTNNIDDGDGFRLSLGGKSTEGKGLVLQIGDTSDDFNQLKVSVGDMHVKALGLDKVSLGTQAGAQAAVAKIKDAINYVSQERGTLGATQNRLEHTSNNLSVMKENIQDAESSIRDTDVAEEMMAYTKNNILVQSAQAMLAQANQIPQGVLQLLG